MIRKHSSLVIADKVLLAIKRILKEENIKDNWQLECWANGREQGYQLLGCSPDRVVNFGEHRNTGWISVVHGPHVEFDPVTNAPSLLLRKTSTTTFPTPEDAAKFICQFLNGGTT